MAANRKDSKKDQTTFQKFVLGKLREIESRLAVLEARNADEPESEASSLDGLSPIEWPPERRGGRTSKLTLHELTARRDWIIQLVEPHCPEIVEGLKNAQDQIEAANAIQLAIADSPVRPGFFQDPRKCAEHLWSFLGSGRFNGNLRNLANAMAGVPEMSWKRSFDLCVANPPNPPIPMHCRAYRDFLQRNFPEKFRELETAHTAEEVSRVLAGSRSKNPTYLALRSEPYRVQGWLQEGKAKPGSRS